MALAVASSDGEQQPVADLQSLRLELAAVISAAQRAHDTLEQVARDADTRTKSLETKIEELETQNLDRAFKFRELQQENAALRRELAGAGAGSTSHADSDTSRIAQERDRALRQLDKAKKVIKGLLKGNANPLCTCEAGRRSEADVGAAQTRSQPPPVAPGVDSDDETTIRPSRSVASSRGRGTPVPPLTRTERPRDTPAASRAPVSSQESISSIASASIVSDAASSASRAGSKVKVKWYLEFDRHPATVEVQHGPIPFEVLSEQLALDEETESELGCLESMPGYDTRIFPGDIVAFGFRPIVLEGPGSTYLIGWGSPAEAKRTEEMCQKLGDLNIFIWPLKEDAGWFYVGLHSLTFVELEPMWPKLQKADKQRLVAELSERNPGMDTAQFRKDVREGKLVQCCLQLESKGRMESHDFLHDNGLLEGD